MHTNTHRSIVYPWAAITLVQRRAVVSEDEAQRSFARLVVERIRQDGKGNIYKEGIEELAMQLLPSFFQVLKEALRLEERMMKMSPYMNMIFTMICWNGK